MNIICILKCLDINIQSHIFTDKFKVEVDPPSLSLQYEDFANISC